MNHSAIVAMMFNYNKRKLMKEQPGFHRVKECWDNGMYTNSQKVGSLAFIMKKAHSEKIKENPNGVVQQTEWTNYYLESGKQRKTILDEGSNNEYQTNQYYGRTLDELYELAMQFHKDLKENYKIEITEQAALNIVVIKVIDDTFFDYMRMMSVLFKLKARHQNAKLEIAEPLLANEYGIDIVSLDENGDIKEAIKIYPESAYKNKEEKIKEHKDKYSIFQSLYDVEIQYIFSSAQGFIKGDFPIL